MLAHIKTQVENPQMPERGFALDRIMHLYINFHRLALTRGSSYIDLKEWIKGKMVALNPQNEDKECFIWAVIAALHHEELKKIINAYRSWILMKTNIARKGLSFQYQSRRSISLRRTTLA